MLMVAWWPVLARGQTFDAHGPSAPPDGVSVRDPYAAWGARIPGAPTFGISGEAGSDLLVREVLDAGVLTEQPVLDDLFGLNLASTVPVSSRIAFGAQLPIWLASGGEAGGGAALGDLDLWVPIQVVRTPALRLGAAPLLRVPTGADVRYLGDPGLGLGGLATAGIDAGLLAVNLDLGADWTARTDIVEWPGGLFGRFAGAVGLAPTEGFAVHLESRGRAPLFRSLPSVPAEVLLTAKVRPDPRFWLSASGGTALLRGVGAPDLRMVVAAQVALGSREVETLAPVAGEGGGDLHVVDERGWPVRGATARVGRVELQTDADGYAVMPPRTSRIGRIEVEANGFLPAVVDVNDPLLLAWEVRLVRRPVPVAVSVVGADGPIEGVQVTVTGPTALAPADADEAGVRHYDLTPGTWIVAMEAPGLGRQERTIEVDPSRTDPIRVDAVLRTSAAPDTALTVRVVDPSGEPVEDATVSVGEQVLGTTGSGGDLTVYGLPTGDHAIQVRSTRLAEATIVRAAVALADRRTVEAVLQWAPGSVVVRATGPDGRPTDARVALHGPATLPSRALGTDGEELFVLRPGTWDVLVSSPALGTQQRRVEVGDEAGVVIEVAVVLQQEESGRATLDLQVVDATGRPLPEVAVALDGAAVGTTGPAGDLTLLGLDEGGRSLTFEGDLLVPKKGEIDLVAGRQVHRELLWWVDGVVQVETRGPARRAVDSLVLVSGPIPVPPRPTGPDGKATFVLEPGRWQLAFSNPSYGTQSRTIDVVEGSRQPVRIAVDLLPVHEELGSLSVLITGPDQLPVRGVEVFLDDEPIGTAPSGSLAVEGLPLGPAKLRFEAAPYADAERDVEISTASDLTVPMGWAAGALEVRVQGPAGPVDALLLVHGPTRIPAQPVVGGVARFALPAGDWWILASHPDFSAQEQKVRITDAPELATVAIELRTVDPEAASVTFSVTDEAGVAVPGVQVQIDGVVRGTTSEGGTIALAERVEGKTEIVLSPPAKYLPATVTVDLERGEPHQHAVVLSSAGRTVRVATTAPDGSPVDAEITAFGPREVPVTRSGSTGAELALPPGTWTVLATSPQGTASAEVRVGSDDAPMQIALVLEPTETTVSSTEVRLSRPILFDVGSADLRPDSAPLLDDVARRLIVDRTASLVEVQGHTSEEGGLAYNQQLSDARAVAIRTALIERGVPRERLIARGYGLSRPITTLQDDASRARNRRVELVVVQRGD